jgi:hypothetical protein
MGKHLWIKGPIFQQGPERDSRGAPKRGNLQKERKWGVLKNLFRNLGKS